MNGVRKVTEDLYWVGVNDKRIELFENIHPIPEGVSYNAYLLLDEKTVLFDTVDWSGCQICGYCTAGHIFCGTDGYLSGLWVLYPEYRP